MSWKLIGKPRVTKATHQLAEQFQAMTPAPGDRDLRDSRSSRIRHLLLTGQYRTGEFASAFCHETGETYRVNGKHTSNVMAAMNGELPKDVHVIVEQYECDTLDDVARLYATFDSRDSLRSTRDINRAYAGTQEDLASLPPRFVDACVTGLAFEKWEDTYTRYRPEERSALLLEHGNFAVWVASVIGGCGTNQSTKHVCRGPVVAAMARTFFKSQKAATEFWSLVKDGSGTDHRSPDRVLHKYLLTHSVNNGRGSGLGKNRVGQRELYVKCLHAWNAWRRGTNTDLKYHANSDTPKAV